MSTINTIVRLIKSSNFGVTFNDKLLSFLLAGLNSLGDHRLRLRKLFFDWINTFAEDNAVQLSLKINNSPKSIIMRYKNRADYLIGGELVQGAYKLPDFIPKTIIDGGANIGMFAIYALSHFPQSRLICYEPDSSNLEQLLANLQVNCMKAEVHEAGLWSQETTLYYHAQSTYDGFIDENPSEYPIRCVLPEVSLDCWMKLDIEGGEYKVLPALFEKNQYPRWISIEIHYFDSKGQELLNLLHAHNYTVQSESGLDLNKFTQTSCQVIFAYHQEMIGA